MHKIILLNYIKIMVILILSMVNSCLRFYTIHAYYIHIAHQPKLIKCDHNYILSFFISNQVNNPHEFTMYLF